MLRVKRQRKAWAEGILPIVIALLVNGCGQRPDQPVYDTVNNPEGFPSEAVALLDSVENDFLTTYDDISGRFGLLYTGHSDLLGNEAWRSIVERLGLKLQYKGEQQLGNGLSGFTAAADYFALASLARPHDRSVVGQYSMFNCWREAASGSELGPQIDSLLVSASADLRLRLTRHFILCDSLGREFVEQYLYHELFDGDGGPITAEEESSLKSPDFAIAAYLGLIDYNTNRRLVSYSESDIDLAGLDVYSTGENVYRVELYFYPHESIDTDYTIALRFHAGDGGYGSIAESLNYVPFDFAPDTPASQWPKEEVAMVTRSVEFVGPVEEVEVGLLDPSTSPARLLRPLGGNSSMYRMDLSSE